MGRAPVLEIGHDRGGTLGALAIRLKAHHKARICSRISHGAVGALLHVTCE